MMLPERKPKCSWMAKVKTNDFKGLTNQQLLVAWLGRHELNRKMRLALKKEMKVRRVRTGGFLEL